MAVIDLETQNVLDTARNRYGRTVNHQAADSARASRTRAALNTYITYLASHADTLLEEARSAIDGLPPAVHTHAWRDLLDSLAASHTQIARALARPAATGSAAEREQHTTIWPHLAVWADYGPIAADLAEQHHQPPSSGLCEEERQLWTERARDAQGRGELDLIESWYVADGRPITLAYLVEDDDSTVVAVAGDPDAPGWEVIGHYLHEYSAGQALPRAVPAGVLRPDAASRFNRPEPPPERPLQELVQEIVEARTAGDVSEVLLSATQQGYSVGPMVRLQHVLSTAAEFSRALDTAQGQQIGVRIDALARQLGFLVDEVHGAAEDLGATVAVLPPHRTPRPPRNHPRPGDHAAHRSAAAHPHSLAPRIAGPCSQKAPACP